MTPLTQPMTDAEREKVKEWQRCGIVNMGLQLPDADGVIRVRTVDFPDEPDRSNAGIDFFALNAEFS